MADLVKDILCFANTIHDKDCYLIIGVTNDFQIIGVETDANRMNQEKVHDLLSSLRFGGDIEPNVSVETILYGNHELDVITIYKTNKGPFYLTKPYISGDITVRQGNIYSRTEDRNTAYDACPRFDVVENLWKKHFGLLKPAVDFIFDSLSNKLDWFKKADEKGYYYIYKPEYTLEQVYEEDISVTWHQFYSYAVDNDDSTYYYFDIKASGTLLDRICVVLLDSARLCIPAPEWGFIYFDKYKTDTVSYKFYVEGTHSKKLLDFLYEPEESEQEIAFNKFSRVILFFKSEDERQNFDKYICDNQQKFQKQLKACKEYSYINTGKKKETENYKKLLRTGFVLNEMMKEFRDELNSISNFDL